jgi:hypothetical protein
VPAFGGAAHACCPACRRYPTGPPGPGNFKPMAQHSIADFPDSAFGRNAYERKVLVDYAASEGLSPADVFTHCLTEVDAARWPAPKLASGGGAAAAARSIQWTAAGMHGAPPPAGQLPLPVSDYECCVLCASEAFGQLLYNYREGIPAAELPDAVTRRPNCWYGNECRTQSHNYAHAEQKNHICENTKGRNAGGAGRGRGGGAAGN